MSRRECQLVALGRVVGQRAREAAEDIGRARDELSRQTAKLDELAGYLREYGQSCPLGGNPALFANREAFMRRLRQAVEAQQSMVAAARQRVETAQARWLGERREANGVDYLLERERATLRRAAAQREQRALDEQAALRHARAEKAAS